MSLSRKTIVAAARGWTGTPYLHQASLRNIGCDCLGLVRGVWRETIGEEPELTPPYPPNWAKMRLGEPLLDALDRHFVSVALADFRPGDVVAFRFRDYLPATHLAIMTTPTHMAHAHSGACVAEAPLGPHWRERLAAAFVFPGVVD